MIPKHFKEKEHQRVKSGLLVVGVALFVGLVGGIGFGVRLHKTVVNHPEQIAIVIHLDAAGDTTVIEVMDHPFDEEPIVLIYPGFYILGVVDSLGDTTAVQIRREPSFVDDQVAFSETVLFVSRFTSWVLNNHPRIYHEWSNGQYTLKEIPSDSLVEIRNRQLQMLRGTI